MEQKTLQEITQDIIAQVSGASKTDESKFYEPEVDNIVDEGRAALLANPQMYQTAIISPLWQTIFYPEFSEYEQTSGECYVDFKCPAPIIFPDGNNSIVYVGSRSGYIGYDTIGMLGIQTDMAHPITNPFKNGKMCWSLSIDETGFVLIRVYNNTDLENIMVKLVAAKPSQNPYFRRDTDMYPISGELIERLKTGVVNKLMVQMAQVPADTIADGEDPLNMAYKALNTLKRGR